MDIDNRYIDIVVLLFVTKDTDIIKDIGDLYNGVS